MPGDEIREGTFVLHRNGDVRQVDRRKASDDGWWLTDGSGLADAVLRDGDWIALTPSVVARVFAATETPDAT